MQRVNCTSVISGTYGERLFTHIIYEGNGFNVVDDFFDVGALGLVTTKKVTTYKGERLGLVDFSLDNQSYRGLIPKTIELEDGSKSKVSALVFLRGPKAKHVEENNKDRLRTNLRVPMSSLYWREISRIERLGDKDRTRQEKEDLKNNTRFNFCLEDAGSLIILPRKQMDQSSYLVAMSADSSFEWVLSRRSNFPNCYRIHCDKQGRVTLHDPRKESRQVIK